MFVVDHATKENPSLFRSCLARLRDVGESRFSKCSYLTKASHGGHVVLPRNSPTSLCSQFFPIVTRP